MDRDRDSSSQGSRETEGNLAERLRNVLLNQSEGDLLINNRNGDEIGLLRWLRALDLQVIGACRADERLKPLLKFDISNGFAEDRLLNQFAQHFEASEVGILARCLCAPLVSIRVGKGNLNLILLPSSKLRISFVGDDGATERVAVISCSSEVLIEEISADSSGRSFHITVPGYQVFYFWCSEKSKLHGMELLAKMKDIVRRKPALSDLTGIRESRLQSFATHLRAYLLTSSNSSQSSSLVAASTESPTTLDSVSTNKQQTNPLHKTSSPSKKRQSQYGLSPKPITFKGKCSNNKDNNNKPSQQRENNDATNTTQPEAPNASSLPASTPLLEFPPPPEIIPSKSMFSPYYCWCPLPPSSPLNLNNSMPLPPLSSLFSSSSRPGPPQVPSKLPFDVPKLPIVTLPASTHISTFAPFMSDPIVHTPIIDICSSGQLYLVSAGATMSSSVSPLLPSFVGHPLMPNTESAVEKSARETLRMLMASTPPFNCLKKPSFLNSVEENSPTYPIKGSDDGSYNLNKCYEGNAASSSSSKDESGETVAVKNIVGCESVDEFGSTNCSKNN